MSSSFQYRLIYNDEIDPVFVCSCPVFSPCDSCKELENGTEWIDLPHYNISRFNKFIPTHGVFFPEDLESLLDHLHSTDESDEDFHDKMEAFQVIEELYYKSDGYIVQVHYD
jgi:hypothetical protein